jgi:hypothetical protein
MIEYILAAFALVVVILLVINSKSSPNRRPRIPKDHSHEYHGVYSHDSKSPDSDVYFPVLKDFSSIMPMNKREERKKTETYQPRK